MKFNPFLIETQREGEDRVTYALTALLEQGGPTMLLSLLDALGLSLEEAPDAALKLDLQTASLTTRPDAFFEIPGRATVIFENKIVPGTLRKEQLVGHLALRNASPGARQVLLAVAPETAPPDWWEGLKTQYPDVAFVYGSWSRVAAWAKEYSDPEEADHLSFLLDAFVHYLDQSGVVRQRSNAFDPERMKRLFESSFQWREDFFQQHQAQEEFLANVESELRKQLEAKGVTKLPKFKSGSRWAERWCPFPASSCLEFWWPAGLAGWGHPHMWGEVALRTPTMERPGFCLRSGLIFDRKELVANWFGRVQEAAQQIFGPKLHVWRRRMSYGDILLERSFDSTRPDQMKEQLAEDLLSWIFQVFPLLAKQA